MWNDSGANVHSVRAQDSDHDAAAAALDDGSGPFVAGDVTPDVTDAAAAALDDGSGPDGAAALDGSGADDTDVAGAVVSDAVNVDWRVTTPR